MMKFIKEVGLSISILSAVGCASIGSVSEIQNWNQEMISKTFEEGKDADVKFLFKDFNDVYTKENKIKSVAILFVNLAWDSKEYREIALKDSKRASFMSPQAAPDDYREVANAVMEQMKKDFSGKGFTVLTPTELAEKSPTFAAIQYNKDVYTFSPTFGQEFQGISAVGSRYIDKWERDGDVISKIAKEAGVDAFVSYAVNMVDSSAYEAEIDGLPLFGAGGKGDVFFSMCVSNERAKELGVSMGLFGKPNHCGSAQGSLTFGRYLPSTRKSDHPKFNEVKSLGFESMKAGYTQFSKGLVEEFYSEAFD
ncbi:MAG: hypothetical protein ACLGGX_07915 [Bdellovibrionia bacterium]